MFNWNDLKFLIAITRSGLTLGAAQALKVNQTTVARRTECAGTQSVPNLIAAVSAARPNG